MEARQHEESRHGQVHPRQDYLRYPPFVALLAREHPRDGKSHGQEREVQSRIHLYPDVFGIHRYVGRRHPVGYGEEQQCYPRPKPFLQEEPVQRYRLALHRCPVIGLYQKRHAHAQRPGQKGTGEDGFIRISIVHEQAYHRSEAHRQIIRQPVISYPFATPRRGQDINYQRIARHRNHPERQPMQNAQRNEPRQRRRQYIPPEDGGKGKIRRQIQRPAGKRIQQKTRERPDTKASYRIARQHNANHRLVRRKLFLQIEGEYRQYQIECEKQQKVRRQYITEARRKHLIFSHNPISFLPF